MYAQDALRLAGVAPGMSIADVACGPGDLTFAAARRGACVCAVDFSPEMIDCLQERALRDGMTSVEARVGDGMALPYADGSFDCAFSLFGLIFFPDRAQGLRELWRILKPGGRAVVGSWVPFNRVPILDDIYRTLGGMVPSLPFNGHKAPLGDATEFRAEMMAAGFCEVEIHEIAHAREVANVDEYWNMLARSTPPLHAVREALGQEQWPGVVQQLLGSLREKWGPGPQCVSLIANLAVGRH
jgi:ubiquinone/menaquinone biosynthesis C-methylase UbiE